MPEQTDQPLLSDEQINRLGIAHVDLYHGEAMRAQAGIERGTILPRGWSYMDGVFKARDIYEQARQQDKDRIEELTGLVRELVDAAAKSDSIMLDMAERGYYPHAALQDNGGDGLGFNTSALSKAKQSGFTSNT